MARLRAIVGEPHQVVFHVAFGFGKELDATGLKEPFCQCFGDIASVSKDLKVLPSVKTEKE